MYIKALFILSFLLLSNMVVRPAVSEVSQNLSMMNGIVVIDVKKVLSDSLAAKSILKDLNDKMAEYQVEINKKSTALQKKHDMLKEQSNVLAENVVNEKQQEIFQQLKLLEKDVKKKKEKLQSAYVTTLQKIEAKVMEIIEVISKKNDYNMVLTRENLLYYQNLTDISGEVISRLNSELPKIKLSLNDK